MSFTAGPVFTNVGRALHARAMTGATLTFTKMQMGDGNLGSHLIANLTALISPVASVNIATMKAANEYAKISGLFSNSDIQTGFYWREIGLWAADPDYPNDRTKDILYCYQNAGALADYIPAAGSELITKRITIAAVVSNVSSVTATLSEVIDSDEVSYDNTGSSLSSTNVQDAIDELDDDLTAHKNNQNNPHGVSYANLGTAPISAGGTGKTTAAEALAALYGISSQATKVNAGGDLNNCKTVGMFFYSGGDASSISNVPESTQSTLIVLPRLLNYSSDPTNLIHICLTVNNRVYIRHFADSVWGNWYEMFGAGGSLVPIGKGGTGANTADAARANLGASPSGEGYDGGGTTITGYISATDNDGSAATAWLNNTLQTMAEKSAKQILFACYPYLKTASGDSIGNSFLCTLYKFSNNIAVLYGVDYVSNTLYWRKYNGSWQPYRVTTGIGSIIPINEGGTGATTAEQARSNLGVPALSDLNAISQYTVLTGTKTAGSDQVVTTTPIPTSGWTVVTNGTKYINGGYEISANSYNGYVGVFYAFDDNDTSLWASDEEDVSWVKVKLPSALTVTKMKIAYSLGNNGQNIKIQGSNNDSTWADLYTETAASSSLTVREVTLTSSGSYQYYRILFTKNGGTCSLGVWRFSSYTVQAQTMAYTAAGVPSTLQNNQMLLVQTPSVDTLGVSSNTVNGVSVDTILKPSTKYELIFNTNKFYAKEAV